MAEDKAKDIPSLLPLAPGGVYSNKWENRAKWADQIEVDPVEYSPPYSIDPNNPTCFLDVRSGGYYLGRIVIELKNDKCPKTSENFLKLCEYKCYTGSMMNVWPAVKVGGGDFTVRDPLVWNPEDPECFDFDAYLPDCLPGGQSVFGAEAFPDENYLLPHSGPGVLTMAAENGKDKNGSQFLITLMEMEDMDGEHVAFGQVIDGFDVLNSLSKVGAPHQDGSTFQRVTVEGCGVLNPGKGTSTVEASLSTLERIPTYRQNQTRLKSSCPTVYSNSVNARSALRETVEVASCRFAEPKVRSKAMSGHARSSVRMSAGGRRAPSIRLISSVLSCL